MNLFKTVLIIMLSFSLLLTVGCSKDEEENPKPIIIGLALEVEPFATLTTSVVIEDLDFAGIGSLGNLAKTAKTLVVTQFLIDALKGLTSLGDTGEASNGESEGRVYFGDSIDMLSQIALLQSGATKQIKSIVEVSSTIGEKLVHTVHGGKVKYYLDKAINGKRAFSKVTSSSTVEYLFSITMS